MHSFELCSLGVVCVTLTVDHKKKFLCHRTHNDSRVPPFQREWYKLSFLHRSYSTGIEVKQSLSSSFLLVNEERALHTGFLNLFHLTTYQHLYLIFIVILYQHLYTSPGHFPSHIVRQ